MKLPFIGTLFLSLVVCRIVIVILHELSHAIVAAALTKKKVIVYLGSYGKLEGNLSFRIGLLHFHLSKNFGYWNNGLCIIDSENNSPEKAFWYTLAGPVVPLMLASIIFLVAIQEKFSDTYITVSFVFLVMCIIDAVSNLTLKDKEIILDDGTTTHTDGYSIKIFLRYRKMFKKYCAAVEVYNKREYTLASKLLQELLDNGTKDSTLCGLALSAYIQTREYLKAKVILEHFPPDNMTADDHCNAGIIYGRLEMHGKALESYTNSLEADETHEYSLNNIGYTLNILEKYDEAIIYFDKAIEVNDNYAYAYNNRGFAKLMLGQKEKGLKDFELSYALDPLNSYYFKNMGIYRLRQKEYADALELFNKAKQLDSDTYKIDAFIAETEALVLPARN